MKFPKYIKYLVDAEKYRLVALAKSTGVHASDLSKVLNMKRACGPKMAAQIMAGLQDEHMVQGLVCYLSDQIPAGMEHLVHIVRAESPVVREAPPDIRTIEGSMQILSSQAECNEAVRKCLMNMAEAFVNRG